MPETDEHFPRLFSPFDIGPITLRNRVILPPHSSAIGNLYGTDREATKAIAYLRARAESGVSWTTLPGRLGNILIPGFEPSGVSAEVVGYFRLPNYLERVSAYVEAMHAAGAWAAQQLTMIGGFPHGPSHHHSSPISNIQPHALSTSEIERFVEEYAFSAARAVEAGIDVIELHANHDDLQEWFLSPLTNDRSDRYGGDLVGRMRFTMEILKAVREATSGRVLGIRMNMSQETPGGISVDLAIAAVQAIEGAGLVDYVHLVTGSPWGNPSYIQPMWFPAGGGAETCVEFAKAISLPIVHTGRINSPQIVERLLEDGVADVFGMARAHIADPSLLQKARQGRVADIRPCVGGNDCINRRYVDGLPFGCAVNPHSGREYESSLGIWRTDSALTVVGGGPAGMELAALCAEAGARVRLVERSLNLGGQLSLATRAPSQEPMTKYLAWQTRRLESLEVSLELGRDFGVDDVEELDDSEILAVATGARERLPNVPGIDGECVLSGWQVMEGRAIPGADVLIVVEDDHLAPLLLADFLVQRGHRVTVSYSTPTAAVLLGRYIVGSILGRLDAAGVRFRYMEKLMGVDGDAAIFRHIYSGRLITYSDFDSIALSCGATSDDSLFRAASKRRGNVHVLGDAYAPRRLVFATRQALALAELLTKSV